MGRIVAIDYGTKRVGLAVTDPLKIIASPLDTIHSKDVIAFLQLYDQKEQIEEFVVGLPKNLDNTETNSSRPVRHFVQLLKKRFPDKKVVLVDERFTSKMALEAMITGGAKKKDRRVKENIDKVSAAIILQSYLESKQFI
jgi:putative holliday junction resolvase